MTDAPLEAARMKKSGFKSKLAVTSLDKKIAELASQSDHRILAVWAADCAERTLPYFERNHPKDDRPRKAIVACREWACSGVFRMADVRKVSLAAHAAARQVKGDDAARSAARAAGQAMATPTFPATPALRQCMPPPPCATLPTRPAPSRPRSRNVSGNSGTCWS